jgi:hypothetical protein
MKRFIAAALLFFSSLVIAQEPSNTDWVTLNEDAKYKVLDTRDDMLMFRFLFAYRDVKINRITFSYCYADCTQSKASAYRHQYVELSSGSMYEDQEHPTQWVEFEEGGNGWKVMQAECEIIYERVKKSPSSWKHFTN